MIDQEVKNIALAIRKVESNGNYQAKGGSGEFGAYQFMPSSWNSWSKKYLGTVAQMTPENQNKVAYLKIKELKDSGLDAKKIALTWNGGSPTIKKGVNKYGIKYDTEAYANKVLKVLNGNQVKGTSESIAPMKKISLSDAPTVDRSNYSQKIDEKRKAGFSDTEILDNISKSNAEMGAKILKIRNAFSNGEKIKNDKDLLNALSIKFSGKMPSVASVPIKTEEEKKKLFTFDVPEKKISLNEKLANANKQAEKYKQEAKQASSPLGFAGNIGRGAFDFMAASEIGLGNTIAKTQGNQSGAYADQVVNLNNTNAQLYKTIKDLEKQGKDATKLKMSYNANVKQIESLGGGLKEESNLPTGGEAIGQLGGTALDVLSAGTYGKAAAGMKSFKLATSKPVANVVSKAFGKNISGALSTIIPESSKVLPTKAGGLFTKQGAKNVLQGAGVGYVNDVSMNLQGFNGEENKTGMSALKPGLGTLIGGTIPTALAGEQSAKSVYRGVFKGEYKNKAVDNLEQVYTDIMSGTTPGKKKISKIEVKMGNLNKAGTTGRTPMRTLAEEGIIPDRTGPKLNTFDQAQTYKEKISKLKEANKSALIETGLSTAPIKIDDLESDALNYARTQRNVDSGRYEIMSKDIKKEFNILRKNNPSGTLPLNRVDDIKSARWDNVFSNKGLIDADKLKKDSEYSIAKALQKRIEKTANDAGDVNVAQLNREIGDRLEAAKFLEDINGKTIKGGRLLKYVTTGIGASMGTTIPGKIIGALGGNVVGELIIANTISSPIKRLLLRNLESTDPKAYTSTIKWLQKQNLDRETRLLLPAPRFMTAGAQVFAEPKISILNAKKGVPGRNPKTGRLFGTLSSEGQSASPINQQTKRVIKTVTNIPTIKSNKLINTSTLPHKTKNVKTKLPIKTDSMFGAVAGIEIDENGKVKFNKEKAIAGIFAMAVAKKISPKQAAINSIKYNLPLQVKYVSKEAGKHLDGLDYSKAKSGVEVAKTISDAIPPKLKTPAILSAIDNWKKSAIQAEGEISNFKKGVVPKTALLKSNPLIQEAKKYKTAEEFVFQDMNQERIIHSRWKSGESYRYNLEGSGDIFRELTKDMPSLGYIGKKIDRIDWLLTKTEEGRLHYDDSITKAMEKETTKLDKLQNLWEKQPVSNKPQQIAKDLNIALIKGNFKEARRLLNETKSQLTDIFNKAHKLKP